MERIAERLKKHYIPLLALTLVAGVFFYFNKANRNTVTFITQASGYISLVLLSVSLILGTLNMLLKNHYPVSAYFRRDLSLTGGILAILHSITGLFVHLRGKTWLYFLNENEGVRSIRLDNFGLANYTGLISALIIMLLIITSNDYMLRTLKQARWKNIQRLSYLMFILIIIHCYFYRIGKQNQKLIYWFYIPVLTIVLIFQIIGVLLFTKVKKR